MKIKKNFAYKTGQNLATEMYYWVDIIEIFPPFEHEGQMMILDTAINKPVLYVTATCDQLRHGTTNYEDELLPQIKGVGYPYSWKEAILNTVKYQTTRKAFKQQRAWILKNAAVDKEHISHLRQQLEQLRNTAKESIFSTQEYKGLLKKYEQEVALRKQLGKNNMSLGGRISGVRKSFSSIFRNAATLSKEDILKKLTEIDQRLSKVKSCH